MSAQRKHGKSRQELLRNVRVAYKAKAEATTSPVADDQEPIWAERDPMVAEGQALHRKLARERRVNEITSEITTHQLERTQLETRMVRSSHMSFEAGRKELEAQAICIGADGFRLGVELYKNRLRQQGSPRHLLDGFVPEDQEGIALADSDGDNGSAMTTEISSKNISIDDNSVDASCIHLSTEGCLIGRH